jgi:APA family basic amino acid/polyamine antiporter
VGSLFFIAFAFSGWNAAIYASDEFKDPTRDVPRAMLVGCLSVGVLYLLVNFAFVANLSPADGSVVFHYGDFAAGKGDFEQVTLGQAVMAHLMGGGAARVMSAVMLLLFISAMSAMMLVGPRVYAAMASDGFLPRFFMPKQGKPPTLAVVLQGLLAIVLLMFQDLREVLSNIGAILVLFAALTAMGLFAARWRAKTEAEKPSVLSLVAASIYIVSAGWMLFRGLQNPTLIAWVAGCSVLALIGWALTRTRQAASAR